MEDLRRFVLECPAYGHVRVRYSAVFGTAPARVGTDLHAIFDCDCQDQLAHALYTMTKSGEHCLSRPQGSEVNVRMLQLIATSLLGPARFVVVDTLQIGSIVSLPATRKVIILWLVTTAMRLDFHTFLI